MLLLLLQTNGTQRSKKPTNEKPNKPIHQPQPTADQPTNKQKNEKANKRQMKAPVCNLRQALLVVKTHPQKDSQAHSPQGLMPLATLTNVNGPLQALSIQDVAAKLSLRRRSGRESASTKALQGKRFTQVSMGHWGLPAGQPRNCARYCFQLSGRARSSQGQQKLPLVPIF